MRPVEFRRQIFRDSKQWSHGLSYRLKPLKGGGIALFSRHAFKAWAIKLAQASNVESFAVDQCGRIFWIRNGYLYRHDPVSGLVEPMVRFEECKEENKEAFGRMISVKGWLWILDRGRSRVIAMRSDTFQILMEIPLSYPIDIAVAKDSLFVLDRHGIGAFDFNGNRLGPSRTERLSAPIAMGADPQGNWLYVIDPLAGGFLRFKTDGSFHDEIGKFTDVAPDFKPNLLAVHTGGNLFSCDDKSPIAQEFSSDGGYIGDTGDLNPFSRILGMSFNPAGEFYVACPEGIANFSESVGLAGNEGTFYTRTLDSGCDGNDCWHRLDLAADLDAGGTVEVSYASTDNFGLATAVNIIFERDTPSAQRAKDLELVLGSLWEGPDQLRAFSPVEAAAEAASRSSFRDRTSHSVLFRSQTKRYLWIKLALSGLAPGAKAAVSTMRVYYPRLSYLRYLPAVYQEDPASREFLERFLSMFETIFSGLEETISRIPEVFDPECTPREFLDWLAQWLDLGIEEEWPAEVKRQLIRKSASLYQKKGRPDGLAEFIEIVIGKRPTIQESFETERPFVLGDPTGLGQVRLQQRPMLDLPGDQRLLLGEASILGTSRINTSTQRPINSFRAAADHFTLLLDLSPPEFKRYERALHRIIRDNSPAHVDYDIRLVSGAGLGPYLTLDVNSRVIDPQALSLGQSALGRSFLSRPSYWPELGIDSIVRGPVCLPERVSAFSYGEQ